MAIKTKHCYLRPNMGASRFSVRDTTDGMPDTMQVIESKNEE